MLVLYPMNNDYGGESRVRHRGAFLNLVNSCYSPNLPNEKDYTILKLCKSSYFGSVFKTESYVRRLSCDVMFYNLAGGTACY
jgi:hypothetical protein